MKIREAIQKIADMNNFISFGAKEALLNEEALNNFVSMILEQYYETEGNKKTLRRVLGDDIINSVLKYERQKHVEADFLLMNECIKNDLK